MATYDGSRSLKMGCDEIYEQECGPCSARGAKKEAKYYCIECLDYLCDTCKGYYGNIAVTKYHNIVSGSKIPGSASGMPRQVSFIACGCSRNQSVEFYCEGHEDVVCSPCKTFHHSKCKTPYIKQKSSRYRSSVLDSVLSKIHSLNDKYDQLKQESGRFDKDIKQLKEACKKAIKSFRKELDAFLDNLEKSILTESYKWERVESHRVDQDMSELTTALKVVDSDCKLLEDAKKNGRKEIIFTADIRVSKALQGYENKLGEFEKNVDKSKLAYKKNITLANLITEVKSFGCLKTQNKRYNNDNVQLNIGISRNEVLLGRNVQSRSQMNVKTDDDKKNIPRITDCAVMPNDYIVLCDYQNDKIKKIKLLARSTNIVECLLLSSPWDVSVLDTNNIVVTSPENKKLHYVQVQSRMKAGRGRAVQLDQKCWGVEVSRVKIYITCHNDPGEAEVRVLDLNGNQQRRLGSSRYQTVMFNRPYHCTFNRTGENIFVSNWDTNVFCMAVDGHIIFEYKDSDMKLPRSLYCDSEDNLMVCGSASNKVQIITANGNRGRTFLSSKDGLKFSESIIYTAVDDMLIVGCLEMENV